jgi:hypothetical protein
LRTSTIGRYFAAALCFITLGSCGEAGQYGNVAGVQSPSPAPTRTPLSAPVVAGELMPPAGSIYFGAYVDTSGLTNGATSADVASLEAQLRRTLALDVQFQSFLTNFGDHAALDDFNNGRVPVDAWSCADPDAAIAAGTYDSELVLKANSVRAYGWPVFIRYFWDPNLPATNLSRNACYDPKTDQPNGVFSPAHYIAAWQHIYAIFQQQGATNAVFVWSVNPAGSNPMAYFPGAAYVNWIGLDCYDTADTTFSATFSPAYAMFAPLQKPIMISETGASGATQPAFFSQAAMTLKTQFPMVKAFVYYDGIFYGSSLAAQNQDWRVIPEAFPEFSAFANDPYMAAMYAL